MKRLVAVVLPALLLSGCGGPLIVPEAGPNAPGFRRISAPPPPKVELSSPAGKRSAAGGAIDSVVPVDGTFDIKGWAILAPDAPRGVLHVVLPAGVDAEVQEVETMMRSDAAAAMEDDDLLWSGFTITIEGTLPEGAGVCVVSRSIKGTFRLGGSDETLCPVP